MHTGKYADAASPNDQDREFQTLIEAGRLAIEQGLQLHLGHGLTYRNVSRIVEFRALMN